MDIPIRRFKSFILYAIIILNIYTYLISNKYFGEVTFFKYIVMFSSVIYFFINIKIKKREVFLDFNIVLFLLYIQFFLLPLIIFLFQGVVESTQYAFISLIYILFCNFLGLNLFENNKFNKYIQIFFIMTFIYILNSFINNYSAININSVITNLFYIDNRDTREAFGFIAPNAFAILIVTNIILSIYLKEMIYINNRKITILMNIIILFEIFLILNTGSRGALISLISFFIVFYYNKIFINKNLKIIKIIIFFVGIAFIIYFIKYFFSLGLNYSKLSSGRIGNWNEVIRHLSDNELLCIGFGYVNSNTFYNSSMTSMLLTDNWFVHTLATQGVIGLILGIIIIILVIKNIFSIKNVNLDYKEKNFFLSFTVLILVYSSIENMFFSINYILSLLYWTSIFYYFRKQKNIK